MRENKRKRGRPRTEGSMDVGVRSRMTDDQYSMIKEYSEVSGKSISEIIRIGALKYALEGMSKYERSKGNSEGHEDNEHIE